MAMFLSQEKNKVWYVYYDNPRTGKRTKITTKTKNHSEAERFKQDFEKRNNLNLISFQDFISKIEIAKELIVGKALKQYIANFKKFFNYLNTQHNINSVNDIKQSHIDSYKSFLVTNKLKPSTIKTNLVIITSILNQIALQELKCLESKLIAPKIKVVQTEKDFLTIIELEEVLENENATCQDFNDSMLFDSQTGLRIQELINLRWHNVDFDTNFIELNNKDFVTKNKKTRVIPLTATALEILQRRFNTHEQKKNDFMFTHKGKKWHTTTLQNRLEELIKKVFGKSKKITWHSMRRTFATILHIQGVDINTISKYLGHSNITTTQKYLQIDKKHYQNSIHLGDYKTLLNQSKVQQTASPALMNGEQVTTIKANKKRRRILPFINETEQVKDESKKTIKVKSKNKLNI